MSEVIVFTSGKGGVGKSNLCLNTALELTARQHRTCLFDGDLGLANVNILLGIDQEYTLDDVVFNQKSLDDILVKTRYGFDIIPGSSGEEQIANLDDSQLESLISALSGMGEYDYFLIDTASGISKSVMSFCMAARQTIIVITHEATSLTDAYALLKILSVNGYQGAVKILINNCDSIPQAKKTYLRYRKVVDKHLDIAIAPAGIILHDDHFERAVVQQKPLLELFPDSIGAQCIKAFVANLTSDDGSSQQEQLADFWQRYLAQIKQGKGSAGKEGGSGRGSDGDALPAGNERIDHYGGRNYESLPRLTDGFSVSTMQPQEMRSFFRPVQPVEGFCCAPELLGVMFKRLNCGEITGAELKQLLIVDPALTAQAMRLATATDDSVAKQHINRLDQIVGVLDDQDIHALLLQAAVASSVRAADAEEENRLRRQWQTSYRCAVFARELAAAASFSYPEEAYLCGLFLQIDQFTTKPDRYGDGTRIGQDAAEILNAIGLNSMMCDAVRFCDYPAEQVKTAFDLVRIVHVARLLSNEDLQPGDTRFNEMLGLTPEQVMEVLEKAHTEIAATFESFGINDADGDKKYESLSGYLLDNLLTGTLMASGSSRADLQGWAQRLHRTCNLLFNMDRIISFVADDEGHVLRAVDYPGCFYSDSLTNFVVQIDNSTSLLSKAYTTGSLVIEDLSHDTDSLNLGDRQLGRLLGDNILICIPLKYGGVTGGVIVCATTNTDVASLTASHSRLSSLGARAARELVVISGLQQQDG